MNIGFYSVIFREEPIEGVAAWAAANGFQSLEIDANHHLPDLGSAGSVGGAVRQTGLEISSLVHFGALLHQDRPTEQRTRERARECLLAAADMSIPAVVFFPGRNPDLSMEANYEALAAFLQELASVPVSFPTRILLENWPGFHRNSIATTPSGWTRLFAMVPSKRIGIEFDPSHLVFQGIDVVPALQAIGSRVHLIHAKDTKLDRQQLPLVGHFGDWWTYCLPGRGEIDWSSFIRAVQEVGYAGTIVIEHEDADFGWPNGTLEARRQGLLLARASLEEAFSSVCINPAAPAN